MKNIVVVESPTKAKTIERYLGKDFHVVASFGHIRELPSKKDSIDINNNFKMHYEITSHAEKHIKNITNAIKNATTIYLATDPDREGESISWHIIDELQLRNKIKPETIVHRICFNEITKNAIKNAIQKPQIINMDLVYAQQARRALDYLVGFQISPILWRKLPGSRSAGRVQSAALRLVCERESEIEKFKQEEYWDIFGNFKTIKKEQVLYATLIKINGKKLEKMSIKTQDMANDILTALNKETFTIGEVKKKSMKRNPYPPFITSTLQQEASNMLNMSPKKTMLIAQKLYEGVEIDGANIGLITYMRTDGTYISKDAVNDMFKFIQESYGNHYLPIKPRVYANKVKNAQEAHEAIRPTSISRTPEDLKIHLDADQFKIYNIIWCRALASQMKEAIFDQTIVSIVDKDNNIEFRCHGSIMSFDGFYKIYRHNEKNNIIPDVSLGEKCINEKLEKKQHFTQPPPRYTDASIIKTLEEFGIGRPSTYATIVSILQDRKYISVQKRKINPTMLGRLVNAFLILFFTKYIAYDFTAKLEEFLDEISNGKKSWLVFLQEFWHEFSPMIEITGQQSRQEVISAIEKLLKHVIFPKKESGEVENLCPKCKNGKLQLKLGKFGGFVGCSKYPECKFIQNISQITAQEQADDEYPKILEEKTDSSISLKKGPYGFYIQLDSKDLDKPKRISISSPQTIDLQYAKNLLSLPKFIGELNNEKIYLDKKKYGFFIKYGEKNYSIKDSNPFKISIPEIQKIIQAEDKKQANEKTRRKSPKKS
ncbi:DNA topoisomerase 1 [Candidatus Xenohaliotis californiensis]|uniref:DNA topoisomerase 1 n=1 Tax=Candidatus Xenohaliotis californiensis TaxID=84677 RepID=A0ABP0EWQ5_9RICK|nr:DNA topoisomerase 1 [Candidatus Xenohaliotis californiensis]